MRSVATLNERLRKRLEALLSNSQGVGSSGSLTCVEASSFGRARPLPSVVSQSLLTCSEKHSVLPEVSKELATEFALASSATSMERLWSLSHWRILPNYSLVTLSRISSLQKHENDG